MVKVFALRYIKLRPEIAHEEFAAFIRLNLVRFSRWPGMNWLVAEGERGDRAGRYALLEEFESVERRNAYFPADGVYSLAAQQLFVRSTDFIAEWEQFGSSADDKVVFTDYVVIGEF